jgi:tetratricopeptide (TPR) repeat protein
MRRLSDSRCHAGRCALWAVLAVLGGGCAPAVSGPAVPGTADIPRYEAHLVHEADNPQLLVPLAAAYREAGRMPEARTLLERALEQRPNEPGTVVLLGLTYEDLGLLPEADELYRRYLRVSRSPRLHAQIQGRIRLIERQVWLAAARTALEREAELAATPPQPHTVAVFPFLYQGVDEQLRPLGRALAELVVTDLAQVQRLRVLERTRVQLLLDEVRLAEEGLVDPSTAVRGGRLLGAGRIVQGRIGGEEAALELEAAVINVGDDLEGRISPVSEQDAVRRLFDMQKRLVFGLFPSLGIELTPAERARIARRPTQNLQALLHYGMGLEIEDRGAFLEAVQYYTHAASLDLNFALAHHRAEMATRAAEAERTTTQQLTQQALEEFGAAEAGLAAVEELVPIAGGRNAASEALGQEFIGSQGAVLRIIVRPRPGGGS